MRRKGHYGLYDDCSKFIQSQDDGITFSHPGFMENYLREESCILLHFKASNLHSGDSELLACFHNRRDAGYSEESITVPSTLYRWQPAYRRDASESSDKHVVFVDNVKAMESPERVIPSLVWVDVPDRLYDVLPHALYLSSESGLTFRGCERTVKDWELSLWSRLGAIGPDERTREVVECGAKIVDCIAKDQASTWRQRISLEDMDRWLSRLTLHIYPQAIRLSGVETSKFGFEVLDVLVGPLDFLSDIRNTIPIHTPAS